MAQLKSGENDKALFAPETAASLKLIACALVSIVLMTIDHRQSHLEVLRNALATTLYPLQHAAQLPVEAFGWVADSLESRSALQDENTRLREKQLFINAQLQKLTALEAENRRLRALLESTINVSAERVLIAEILAVDLDPYRHQILINRGTQHGAKIGQPLIDERGIVGQVNHANLLTSSAILITDPSHAIPVQLNRNGIRTLAVGTGKYNELELPNIPNNGDVKVGDLVITSGLGGRFPRGYPVARVTRVEFDPGRPFAKVIAEPTAHLDRIREVLLILDDIPDPARQEPPLAAPPPASAAPAAPVAPAAKPPARTTNGTTRPAETRR